jgi:predicted membrane channel-forming protein YqfA (hemolysin III family)
LKPFIGIYSEAPHWMRYDELKIGYRINFYSFKLILKSIFMVHNETANIWSHLIGAFTLLLIAFLTYNDSFLNLLKFNLLFHDVSENISINIHELGIDNYLSCPVSESLE